MSNVSIAIPAHLIKPESQMTAAEKRELSKYGIQPMTAEQLAEREAHDAVGDAERERFIALRYRDERAQKYPAIGDQLDAIFKHRQKQKMLVGKARAALEMSDLTTAMQHLLEAVEPTKELDDLDAQIFTVKKSFPKP